MKIEDISDEMLQRAVKGANVRPETSVPLEKTFLCFETFGAPREEWYDPEGTAFIMGDLMKELNRRKSEVSDG